MNQAIKDAKGKSPSIAATEKAYLIRMGEIHAMLLRSTGNAQKATGLEERVLNLSKTAIGLIKNQRPQDQYARFR